MTPRQARRVVLVAVALLALVDIVLAAVPHRRHGVMLPHDLSPSRAFAGPRYLLLVASVALLAVLPGLRAAKRNAWRIALAVSAMSMLGHHPEGLDLVGLAVAGIALLILVGSRSNFPVPSDPPRAAQGWWLLFLGELAVLTYGAAGLGLLSSEFRHEPSLLEALVQAGRLLLLLPTSALDPLTHHGEWFLGSVRFLSLLVVFLALARVLTPALVGPARRAADRGRVERLLEEWGTSTVSFFHLLPDKTWFFAADGEAFLSYRMTGRVAVVLAGPVGEPGARRRVVHEFLERCELNGWIPAFHQAGEDERALLEHHGFTLLKVGEEPIVDIQSFTLDVPALKSVRSAIRRVQRSGHCLEDLPQPIDDATMQELREVSDAWLHAGGHRERTFTVGQFDPDYLRSTTVLAVRDASQRIVAFANVVPSYRSAEGNFDLMRRRPDTVNGVMDFLLAGLLERLGQEGKAGMTLGLAPLANVDDGGVVGRSLRLLREHGFGLFNYEGLHRFKAKWATRWEPRYLAYPTRFDLPRIALAVARVGEVADSASVSARGLAVVRRLPFSTALISLEVWLMAATTVDPFLERFLIRHFGLSWPDLLHGQWWRIVTGVLIQPRGGLVVANLALVCLVPVAEWRFGSRRTIAGFFLGDWVSSLPTLAVLRVLGAFGNRPALAAALRHDAGPSSAAYALVAMVAASLGDRRVRVAAISVVVASAVGPLLWYGRLFDVQHLIAIGTGIVLAAVGPGRWVRGGAGDSSGTRPAGPGSPPARRRGAAPLSRPTTGHPALHPAETPPHLGGHCLRVVTPMA